MWPGTSLPPNAKPVRRRRTKGGGKRRRGPTPTERIMIAQARSLGIAPRAKKTTEIVPRCLDHCFEDLNFSSAWDLANFIAALDARRPLGKRKGNLRLPDWKTPQGQGVKYAL